MHIFYFSLGSMSILEVRFSRLIPFLHISNRYVCWARPAYQAMLKILERLNVHFLFSLGSMSAGRNILIRHLFIDFRISAIAWVHRKSISP